MNLVLNILLRGNGTNMIRIGKMTDYGIVLLSHLASNFESKPLSARDLAELSKIPPSTVSQILKTLARVKLLASQRGLNGGYKLARSPESISIAEIIGHLEGPIAITECSNGNTTDCILKGECPTRNNWQKINKVVYDSLAKISLKDMNHTVPMTNFSNDTALSHSNSIGA